MPEKSEKKDLRIIGSGGERTLSGNVSISGSKNLILPLFASAILFDTDVTFTNAPDISDVYSCIEILKNIGYGVITKKENDGSLTITIKQPQEELKEVFLKEEYTKKIRGSIIFTGPLLARYGSVVFQMPGGCAIGNRGVDFFLNGYKKMGAHVEEDSERDCIRITCPKNKPLSACSFFLSTISVTSSETLIMTALLADGKSTFINIANEPEVLHLIEFLKNCGAQIEHTGGSVVCVVGGGLLKAYKPYTVHPDRIETASFLLLGALSGNDITIQNCSPNEIESVLVLLNEQGFKEIQVREDSIRVIPSGTSRDLSSLPPLFVRTHEYPGIPTDIQSMLAVYTTQLSGKSTIFESIFERRFGYVKELRTMGGHLKMLNRREVLIYGPTPLYGTNVVTTDLRAGFALLMAAIIAEGETNIKKYKFIERGYENIYKKLTGIGVKFV